MKRLATEDLNTPERFDMLWKLENIHYFDRVRAEAFTDYVRPGMRILDVGAGMYGWAQHLLQAEPPGKSGYDAHAIDFSPWAIAEVRNVCPNLQYIEGNALALPYPDEHFDVVGAGELIEHMEVPGALVRELARVTRPGGLVIIGTVDPDCEDSLRNGCEYPEHLWQFTPGELLALVEPHGKSWYSRVGNYDFVYCRKHGTESAA